MDAMTTAIAIVATLGTFTFLTLAYALWKDRVELRSTGHAAVSLALAVLIAVTTLLVLTDGEAGPPEPASEICEVRR